MRIDVANTIPCTLSTPRQHTMMFHAAPVLPARDNGLLYLCRLARKDAGFLPQVFEALLHLPVAMLVDPGEAPPVPGTETDRAYPLLQIRHPGKGVPEFSAALFSDMEHFYAFHPQRAPYSLGYQSGIEPFEQIAACPLRLPVAVDPCSPHAMVLPHEQIKIWLAVWRAAPCPADPMEPSGCAFRQASAFPQKLLDRLAAFLCLFESVERAYLVYSHPFDHPDQEWLTLAVSCGDSRELERIGRAFGLLGDGLPGGESLRLLLPLSRYSALERDFARYLQPVYARPLGRWMHEGMTA